MVVAALVLLVGTLTSREAEAVDGHPRRYVLDRGAWRSIASGAAYGLNGERTTHHHETTGAIAEESECGAEETEADEHASQNVAAKSNVAGRRSRSRPMHG